MYIHAPVDAVCTIYVYIHVIAYVYIDVYIIHYIYIYIYTWAHQPSRLADLGGLRAYQASLSEQYDTYISEDHKGGRYKRVRCDFDLGPKYD